MKVHFLFSPSLQPSLGQEDEALKGGYGWSKASEHKNGGLCCQAAGGMRPWQKPPPLCQARFPKYTRQGCPVCPALPRPTHSVLDHGSRTDKPHVDTAKGKNANIKALLNNMQFVSSLTSQQTSNNLKLLIFNLNYNKILMLDICNQHLQYFSNLHLIIIPDYSKLVFEYSIILLI